MGKASTYRPIVTNKLIKLITKYGFINDKGTKHGKYTREGDDHKIMVPRKRTLSPGLSDQIAKDLRDKHGFDKNDILSLF